MSNLEILYEFDVFDNIFQVIRGWGKNYNDENIYIKYFGKNHNTKCERGKLNEHQQC